MLAELEEQVIASPFDVPIRRQLVRILASVVSCNALLTWWCVVICLLLQAYYARDKWRATFLYEEQCATKIQRAFRTNRDLRMWKAQQRNQMFK